MHQKIVCALFINYIMKSIVKKKRTNKLRISINEIIYIKKYDNIFHYDKNV